MCQGCLTFQSLTRATALPIYFFPAKQPQHSFSTTALEASPGSSRTERAEEDPPVCGGQGAPVSLTHVRPELTLEEATTPRAQSLQQDAPLPSLP